MKAARLARQPDYIGKQAGGMVGRQPDSQAKLGHIRWLKCLLIIQWTGKCQIPLTFFTAAHSDNGRLHYHGGSGANAMRKLVRLWLDTPSKMSQRFF